MINDEEKSVILEEILKDRKRDRVWRMVRFGIAAFLFLAFLGAIGSLSERFDSRSQGDINYKKPYVSLVYLSGEIMAGRPFSASQVDPLLKEAFRDKHSKGVLLEINSPGGSPVQATIIHDYILYLKKRYRKKVVVLGDDALASGAYLVATAADQIYVHPDTLTGSIGVIMGGFGFSDAIKKIGVTRRIFTAGAHKDRLDPFASLDQGDVNKVHQVLSIVHQHFIDDVIAGRHHLKGDPSELFSGDFWPGSQAVTLGLADGTTNRWELLKSAFNVGQFRVYRVESSFWQQVAKGASSMLPLHLGLGKTHLVEELPTQ